MHLKKVILINIYGIILDKSGKQSLFTFSYQKQMI